MSKIVQEKFQVDNPYQGNDDASARGGHWVTDSQARAKKNMDAREGLPGGDYNSRYMTNAKFLQSLPPGSDIEDQETSDIRRMGINTSGQSGNPEAPGDVTQDINERSLVRGYDRKKLLSTDDEYTRQHNDAFYWDAVVDGDEGFVERNNMLDRL